MLSNLAHESKCTPRANYVAEESRRPRRENGEQSLATMAKGPKGLA